MPAFLLPRGHLLLLPAAAARQWRPAGEIAEARALLSYYYIFVVTVIY